MVDATYFKRDIIAEVAEACYKHDMKLRLYYSQAIDWAHPHGAGDGIHDELNWGVMSWGNDWDYPDAKKKNYKICFEEKVKPQVKEILSSECRTGSAGKISGKSN